MPPLDPDPFMPTVRSRSAPQRTTSRVDARAAHALAPRARRLAARRLGAALAAALILASGGEVSAQQATALDRFDPAPVSGPFFAVPSAEITGRLRPFGGAIGSVAHAPLVVDGGSGGATHVVDHQVALHLDAGLELSERALVDVSFASILSQGGDATALAGPPAASVVPGDLRLGGRVTLLDRDGWWPAAAMAIDLWLPTGRDDAYAGAGVVRVAPRLVLGVERDDAAWALTAAPRLVPLAPSGLGRSEIEVGAAGGPRFGPVWIGPEIVFRAEVDRAGEHPIGGEARLGAKLDIGPLRAGLAAGPGLGEGPGTPTFRVLVSLGLATELAGDDAARSAGGPSSVQRGTDPSSAAAGASTRPTPCAAGDVLGERGCGRDGDGDGIADAEDACPDARGVARLDAKKHGCPAQLDGDGDGVADALDACPTERGISSDDPERHGCPSAVRFDGIQITFLQQIQFEVGSDRLDPASDALLVEVAQVLADHEEVARLAVDGHTDGDATPRPTCSSRSGARSPSSRG